MVIHPYNPSQRASPPAPCAPVGFRWASTSPVLRILKTKKTGGEEERGSEREQKQRRSRRRENMGVRRQSLISIDSIDHTPSRNLTSLLVLWLCWNASRVLISCSSYFTFLWFFSLSSLPLPLPLAFYICIIISFICFIHLDDYRDDQSNIRGCSRIWWTRMAMAWVGGTILVGKCEGGGRDAELELGKGESEYEKRGGRYRIFLTLYACGRSVRTTARLEGEGWRREEWKS